MKGAESLHNHTVDSDGKQTHLELLSTAEQLGYNVVALTDHDQVPKPAVLKRLRDYGGPVRWIVGTELTSALHPEAPEGSALHILGLFVDPTNRPLLDHCQVLRQSRVERMRHYVKHLCSIGFKLSEKDCLKVAGESLIGSPHIVEALELHPQNKDVLEKIMKRMEAAARHDSELAWKYERMMAEGPRQYPYQLFMKPSSFMPVPEGTFRGALLNLDDSVRLIRRAGGIAILAHWFFDKKKLPAAELEKLVAAKRLDGLETESINLITERDLSRDNQYLHELAAKYQAADVIGADAHDEHDLAHFAKSESAERSQGHTERLISRFKPDLTWSNLAHETV